MDDDVVELLEPQDTPPAIAESTSSISTIGNKKRKREELKDEDEEIL